jgi:hypothetical protein
MTVLNETIHAGGFMLSGNFDAGYISADQIVMKSGQAAIYAGTVLGKVSSSGATATETHASNTGNGVMGAMTVGDGAIAGVYTLKITKAAANAGDFEVIDPQGDVAGLGTVGAAYNAGGLSFTLADGATDFVVGDTFKITVTLGSTKYTQLNLAGTDGTEQAAAILWDYCDASAADTAAAAITRNAEVKGVALTWPGGITAAQKAGAITQLAALGIVVR